MKTFKNLLTILPWALLLIVSITAYVFYNKYNKEAEKAPIAAKTAINTVATFIKTVTDTMGRKHAQFEAPPVVTPEMLKNQTLPGWADTTSRSLDLGNKYKEQVQELLALKFQLQDSLLRAKATITAQNKRIYNYANKYIDLSYLPDADESKGGLFSYKYNGNINVAQFYKKSWFLGRKKSIIDVSSADTNMMVNGVKHYQVAQQDPLLGLRIQALGSYYWDTKFLQPGIGVQFDIGRTSLTGGYYFNSQDNKAHISIGGRYDLIRF